MHTKITPQLHTYHYSLDHDVLLDALSDERKLLIIQDLDGVCMGLVRDPRMRRMDPHYVQACKAMAGRFFVLTNGEHVGSRGVNRLVERAFEQQPGGWVGQQGLYLPGLGAGGVQFQDCFGALSHPGVTDAEIAFLDTLPKTMRDRLSALLSAPPWSLTVSAIESLLSVIVLDNAVSPTINIGTVFEHFKDKPLLYRQFQEAVLSLMDELLQEAASQGLGESFFVHLAPNLGADGNGEILRPAQDGDMGTTDFQFMLRGAVKEAGVLVLLNHYYFLETGHYPLGSDFSARTAPETLTGMLELAQRQFDPDWMPRLVGVGDTVTSSAASGGDGKLVHLRGGSDRGFLTLVQELGCRFESDNVVLFVDSSGGELSRPGVCPVPDDSADEVSLSALRGITDGDDALLLNFLFPGGHHQYTAFFAALAQRWNEGQTE